MYNWDNTQRVASRETLFFYNKIDGNWRAAVNDAAGTDSDNHTQHINRSWACYFTDGKYENWKDIKDDKPGFGLLSWNQYNASCLLVIID